MWQYLAIAISSILAVLATWINTEKNVEGKKHAVFKPPSLAGWVIMILLLVSSFIQLITQVHKDQDDNDRIAKDEQQRIKAEQRRFIDSLNIQFLIRKSFVDSASWARSFALMDTTNIKLNQSRELINTSYRMQMSAFDTAKQILYATNDLRNPFEFEYYTIQVRIKSNSPVIKDFWKELALIKDSLEKQESGLSDMEGTEITFLKGSKNRISKLEIFTDRSPVYQVGDARKVWEKIGDSKNYLVWVAKDLDHLSINSIKVNEAMFFTRKHVDTVGIVAGFNNIAIDFEDSYLNVSLLYKIENTLSKSSMNNLNDLIGKYILVQSDLPNSSVMRIRLIIDKQLKKSIPLGLAVTKSCYCQHYRKITKQDLQVGILD